MYNRIYNFSAGPSMLPVPVLEKAQAEMMRKIEPMLLEDEREVYRRAANSGHLNRPKHASAADYRAATGFEAVIGMLEWIGDNDRLEMLLDEAHKKTEKDGLKL